MPTRSQRHMREIQGYDSSGQAGGGGGGGLPPTPPGNIVVNVKSLFAGTPYSTVTLQNVADLGPFREGSMVILHGTPDWAIEGTPVMIHDKVPPDMFRLEYDGLTEPAAAASGITAEAVYYDGVITVDYAYPVNPMQLEFASAEIVRKNFYPGQKLIVNGMGWPTDGQTLTVLNANAGTRIDLNHNASGYPAPSATGKSVTFTP